MASNNRTLVVLLALLCCLSSASAAITLPKYFMDRMVLQQAPQTAHIWGTTDDTVSDMSVQLICLNGFSGTYVAELTGNEFSVVVGPVPESENCNINIVQGAESIILSDVLFGDVYICSGQSNMERKMSSIDNAQEEIENSLQWDNIRFYWANYHTSSTEEEDLVDVADFGPWEDGSNSFEVSEFSAVCFLYARSMSELVGRKPFGLIGTYWGGTPIEAWSTPESLEACGIQPNDPAQPEQMQNSYLYNAMIHPFTKFSIKGVLWYQGESNSGYNQDQYSCTFKGLIDSWRNRWAERSPNVPDNFPFGFVQLSTFNADSGNPSYPALRWHQTYDTGYVPNDDMENVFMAVAYDTYDPINGIHPSNKKVVGQRLSVAGLNIAYGLRDYPAAGPFLETVDYSPDPISGAITVTVTFDQSFTYNPAENSGFYTCCGIPYDQCDVQFAAWNLVNVESVLQVDETTLMIVNIPTTCEGFAHNWAETPVKTMLGLPIYADDEYALPAAPWKIQLA